MTETQILRAFTVSMGRQLGCKPEEIHDLLQEVGNIHADFHMDNNKFAVINRKFHGNTAIAKYRPLQQTWEFHIIDVTGWVVVGRLAFDEETQIANVYITAEDQIPVTITES